MGLRVHAIGLAASDSRRKIGGTPRRETTGDEMRPIAVPAAPGRDVEERTTLRSRDDLEAEVPGKRASVPDQPSPPVAYIRFA
jgi:hypothetical protein